MNDQENNNTYCTSPRTSQVTSPFLEEGELYKSDIILGESMIDVAQEYEQHFGHPTTGLVDFTAEQPQQYDYETTDPFNPVTEHSSPRADSLAEMDQAERMIADSQWAQIAAGEIQIQLQQQQESFEEQPAMEDHSGVYTDIIQQIYKSQELQGNIQQCLSRLEQARQGIAHHTHRLNQHLQEQQKQEQQQRRRARQRRQRRRQREQQQTPRTEQRTRTRIVKTQLPQNNTTTSALASIMTTATSQDPKPDFKQLITQLGGKLHPFVSVTTGLPHHLFPKSMLAYNLLSSSQLDELALHFHQTYPPTRDSFNYPRPVKPWLVTNGLIRDLGVDVNVKRRRFGRFIGLKGCESPIQERDADEKQEEESTIQTIERDWVRKWEIYKAVMDEVRANALQTSGSVEGPVSAEDLTFVQWNPEQYWM